MTFNLPIYYRPEYALIDNFQTVEKLFDNEYRLSKGLNPIGGDRYIVGYILTRQKDFQDNHFLNLYHTSEQAYGFYYFDSYESMMAQREEIVRICMSLNARFQIFASSIKHSDTSRSLLEHINRGTLKLEDPAFLTETVLASIVKYENTFDGDNLLLVDIDTPNFAEKFRKVVEDSFPDKYILDYPSLTGHHFILKHFKVEEVRSNDPDLQREVLRHINKEDISIFPYTSTVMYYYGKELFRRDEHGESGQF